MNPFSGFEYSLEDHHEDEHYHYENGFGGVGGMGAPLSRAKTIGVSGTGAGSGMTGWKGFGLHSRRTSENGAVAGAGGGGAGSGGGLEVDASGMRPRRISFGWTGFTSGSKGEKPMAQGQVQAQPMQGGQQGGAGGGNAAVGRGRSGSLGQGSKKRKVSPVCKELSGENVME